MAGQSLAMGEAFGKGFQYGKRKISSMTNEEFNALNFQQLSETIATDYKMMIPSLKQSIKDSKDLQDAVFDALGKLILDIPQNIKEFMSSLVSGTGTGGSSTDSTSLVLASALSKLTEVRSTEGARDRSATTNDQAIQDLLDLIEKTQKASVAGAVAGDISLKNRQAQERLEAAARARTASEAQTKKAENELRAAVARAGVVASTRKRKAGQSQIQERKRLIGKISNISKSMPAWKNKNFNYYKTLQKALVSNQAKLTILLQRYSF